MSPLSFVISCSLAVVTSGIARPSDEPSRFLHRQGARGALDFGALSGTKAACRNDGSTFAECKKSLQALRDIAWTQMQEEAKSVLLDGVSTAEMIPPSSEVKGFIMGGTRVTLPACKSQGSSEDQPAPALYFRHIFKSGGHSIMANMHTLGLPALDGAITEHWGATMWEKYDMCHELEESKQTAQTSGSEGPTLFTFVREPIGRFISGYKEIEFRDHFTSPHPKGSVERAAHFVQYMFRGLPNGHVVPQSQYILGQLGSVPGPLGSCPVPFDVIGKLEHFDDDWASIGDRLHCPPGSFLFNRSLGQHLSSVDEAHTTDAMHGALEAIELSEQGSSQQQHAAAMYTTAMHAALRGGGGALMRMLCWFYLGDYALFDYDIPDECGIDMAAK